LGDAGAEAAGAGSIAEESLPPASAAGAPGAEVAEGATVEDDRAGDDPAGTGSARLGVVFSAAAVESFLSATVVGGVAALLGCAGCEESPGLTLPVKSVAAVAAIAGGDCASGLGLEARLEGTLGAL